MDLFKKWAERVPRNFKFTGVLFRKFALAAAVFVLGCFVFQFFYFLFSLESLKPALPNDFDLVLVYTDSGSLRVPLEAALKSRKPLYISKAPWEEGKFYRELPREIEIHVDARGRTTDCNARYAAPFIRSHHFKRVLLVTAWYHVPRARFLTQFYLLGSGVSVVSFSSDAVPAGYWKERDFWVEMGKSWGSLGRVILAAAGWETGPEGALWE